MPPTIAATATPQIAPQDLLRIAETAARDAQAALLTSREKVLLVALIFSAGVMLTALVALFRSRRKFQKHLTEHRLQLRTAFADAYVGMKDGALDAKRVRGAEQAIERIINDLEHYLD